MEGRELTLPSGSFDAALAALQAASHRLARDRHAWSIERQDLLTQVAALAQEKQHLLQLHELLVGRVRMLEFALVSERQARRAAGRSSDDASAQAGANALAPLPRRPPAVDSAEGRVRASQAIIHEFLGLVEQAEADAAARLIPPKSKALEAAAPPLPERPPAAIEAKTVPSTSPAALALAASSTAGRTPSSSAPLPFFSMPPPPGAASTPSGPSSSSRSIGSVADAAHDAAVGLGDQLAQPSTTTTPLSSKATAVAAAPAASDPRVSPTMAATHLRRRVSISGGKPRPGGAAEAARAPRLRGGGAAAAPVPPATWQLAAVLRSHFDIARGCVWLPGLQPTSPGGGGVLSAPYPQLLTCSDDGTAKVWAVRPSSGGAASGGGRRAAHSEASNRAAEAGLDIIEPLRTYRCGKTAVLRAIAVSLGQPCAGTSVTTGGDASAAPGVLLEGHKSSADGSGSNVKAAAHLALVRACLDAAASDDGLSSVASNVLSDSTRNDAVGVLACADGSICIALLPAVGATQQGQALIAALPSSYDLPSAASLPCLRFAAHADSIWALAQAPPGYSVASLTQSTQTAVGVGSAEAAAHEGCTSHGGLTPLPADADTRDMPVIMTASADGSLRLWRLGIRSADGRPGISQLSNIDVDALVRASPSALPVADSSLPQQRPRAIAVAAFDLVSATPAAWVALHGSDVLFKVELSGAGRVGVRSPKLLDASSPAPTSAVFASITSIVPHPQLPLVFASTTLSSRGIVVLDALSGGLLHSLPAHSSGVSAITLDPSGTLLSSSGVEGDVRVWSVEDRVCLWSARAHRGKLGETALGVAFHPTRPALLASVGADSVAKVFIPLMSSGAREDLPDGIA